MHNFIYKIMTRYNHDDRHVEIYMRTHINNYLKSCESITGMKDLLHNQYLEAYAVLLFEKFYSLKTPSKPLSFNLAGNYYNYLHAISECDDIPIGLQDSLRILMSPVNTDNLNSFINASYALRDLFCNLKNHSIDIFRLIDCINDLQLNAPPYIDASKLNLEQTLLIKQNFDCIELIYQMMSDLINNRPVDNFKVIQIVCKKPHSMATINYMQDVLLGKSKNEMLLTMADLYKGIKPLLQHNLYQKYIVGRSLDQSELLKLAIVFIQIALKINFDFSIPGYSNTLNHMHLYASLDAVQLVCESFEYGFLEREILLNMDFRVHFSDKEISNEINNLITYVPSVSPKVRRRSLSLDSEPRTFYLQRWEPPVQPQNQLPLVINTQQVQSTMMITAQINQAMVLPTLSTPRKIMIIS